MTIKNKIKSLKGYYVLSFLSVSILLWKWQFDVEFVLYYIYMNKETLLAGDHINTGIYIYSEVWQKTHFEG